MAVHYKDNYAKLLQKANPPPSCAATVTPVANTNNQDDDISTKCPFPFSGVDITTLVKNGADSVTNVPSGCTDSYPTNNSSFISCQNPVPAKMAFIFTNEAIPAPSDPVKDLKVYVTVKKNGTGTHILVPLTLKH